MRWASVPSTRATAAPTSAPPGETATTDGWCSWSASTTSLRL